MKDYSKTTFYIDEEKLTPEILQKLGHGHYNLDVREETVNKIKTSREVIMKHVEQKDPIYGVTKGIGYLSNIDIPDQEVEKFQYNLIKSHSSGVGKPLSLYQVRTMMALRIKLFTQACCGLSYETFCRYVEAFNKDILPYIPEQGTVGASGDLAPLAHVVLGLIGEGMVWDQENNCFSESKIVLAKKGYTPMKIQVKEGLSLINGIQFISSLAADAVLKAENLARHADIIFSVTFEALNGVKNAFHPKIHEIRNHEGQIEVAARVRSLILDEGGNASEMNTSMKQVLNRVQDGYSIRCVPQVHGITNDTIQFVKGIVTTELNAVTDNPIIVIERDNDGKVSSEILLRAGNFHGEYIAKSMDYLAIAVQELANISERRVERLCNSSLSKLPPFLTSNPGLNSGLMMAQITAAALTSENKVLCHPSSVDSIPTSANSEDHVSMGGMSARKVLQVLSNVEKVLSIELLCATQAFEILKQSTGKNSTQKIENIVKFVRNFVPYIEQDTALNPLIEKMTGIICSKKLIEFID